MPKIICYDKDKNRLEFDSSELTHRPGVYGLLIEDGKILLSKQWDGYDFPGGGVHIQETVEQALKREFWEETGLEVEVGKVLYCKTSFYALVDGHPVNATGIYFLCQKIGGEFSIDNSDEMEKTYIGMPEWIPVQEVGKLKFYNGLERNALDEDYQGLDSAGLIKKTVAEL